ncbi:OmpA family protein [Larkinella knui]|nr:OmpA family protein [Larkinella knui]
MMKRWFLIFWLAGLGWQGSALAQKMVQRVYDPPQRNVKGGGHVSKVEYTNHKMVVFFVAEDRDYAQRATIYGPGHPNCWRLYDTKSNQEFALLYIKNIKADGELVENILDEPRGVRLRDVRTITCEAHFERPGKNVRSVDMIEEDVERYEGRRDPTNPFGGVSSQWPYNVYDLQVALYRDDLRNAAPPAKKAPVKPKPTTPPVQKPAPKTAPPVAQDSVVAQAPPKKETPKPAPAEKVENFGSKVEAGRTYRLNNLLFKQSAYEIEPESYPELDSLVAIMTRNPTMEIELAGHTDNVGDAKLNVALSQKRVDAVKSYLINKGIASSRIQTQAYGGSKPIADNSREETKRLNRRVEVKILKQ